MCQGQGWGQREEKGLMAQRPTQAGASALATAMVVEGGVKAETT